MKARSKNTIVLAIILLAFLIVAYLNHFYNGFHFDDFHAIVNNIHIRSLSNIPQFFVDPTMFSSSTEHYGLRSIVTTSTAIDYWFGGGLYPFYFHLSTFIWHVLLCVMLFFAYRQLINKTLKHHWANYIALLASGLFALHTANAETLNYIISRSDVLSTFFIVASFLIYVAYPEKRKWYLYIIPAIIGVFAKETVLVLVILLFFYIHLFEKKLSLPDLFKGKYFKAVLHTIAMLLPLLVVVMAVQIYTLTRISGIPGISNPAGYYWLTQSFVWLYYFGSFFFPVHLSADTDLAVITNVFDKRIIIGLVFVIALLVAIFKTSKKTETKPIAFGLIWFVAALLPTSLAPFAEVMNDHRMYFAFVGLSLSVVWFIALWLIKKERQIETNKNFQNGIIGFILLVFALHGYGVYQRNEVWYTEETLWRDVTIKSPLNGRGLMNYGLTQVANGNFKGALSYFEKAEQLLPNYSRIYTNIGIVKGALGQHSEAESNFLKGIFLGSELVDSYVFYARYLNQNKRYEEAKSMAEAAYRINPQAIITLNLLMDIYQNLAMWTELEQTSSTVLSILPGDTVASAYLNAARKKKPLGSLTDKTPIKTEPTAADYLNLSLSYYNLGNFKKCIEYCEKAIALKSDYADAYSNMAAAYNQLKEWKKGEEASRKALKIDPNHKFAKGNLKWSLNKKEH